MSVRDLVLKTQQLRTAYKNVSDLVLRDLYKFCRGMQGTYTLGDSHHTAYREGQRSVLIHIFHKRKVHNEQKLLEQLEEMRDE